MEPRDRSPGQPQVADQITAKSLTGNKFR